MFGKYPEHGAGNGVAAHIVSLVNSMGMMDGKKYEFHMISFGDASQTIYDGNAQVKILKIYKIYYLLPIIPILKLMYEVKKIKPDILHVQGINLSPYLLYTLFSGKKYKKVITIHGYPTREMIAHGELKYHTLKYFFLRWIELKGIRDSDLLICVSTPLKKWAHEELCLDRSKKAILQLTAVDVKAFKPLEKSEERRKLGIPMEDFIIFHAKAFVINNGQSYLVRAIPKIIGRIPNVKLYLAGNGPLKPEASKLIDDLHLKNNIRLLGNLPHDQISSYLAASDVVSIPSIATEGAEEGSSIFLIEAMAMEKPCIASDIGGLRDSIKNGVTGLLIPDKDEEAIVTAILQLYHNPGLANAIGKNARAYVVNERNCQKLNDELLRLYGTLKDRS